MLRSDAESAIHDLVVACGKAEEAMTGAARQAADDQVAGFFTEAARRMTAQAAALAEDSRALGDLPATPDQDTLSLRAVVSAIVAAFSPDERTALIGDAIAVHGEVVKAAEHAGRQDLCEDARRHVHSCRDAAARTLAQLREMQMHLQPG
jgi:hypothetical protein